MAAILQQTIPYDPLAPRPLPGMQPLELRDWLIRDDAHAAQMVARDRLIASRRDDVIACAPGARPAARELLETVLELLGAPAAARFRRADGVEIAIDRDDPMTTLGRLVQEDLCLLERRGAEHVLTAAVLCFPAGWSLRDKFLRPLTAIHGPVAEYDSDIARRVQRLFDGVRPGRPIWRCNALWYDDPALHQPRREGDPRPPADPQTAPYLRSERQCILRLPRTGAVVFSIHTFVLPRAALLAASPRAGGAAALRPGAGES